MNSPKNSSQDYDRKHGKDHIVENPRSVKSIPTKQDDDDSSKGMDSQTADFLSREQTAKSKAQHVPMEDKRKTARQEHTNHFTNRASDKK